MKTRFICPDGQEIEIKGCFEKCRMDRRCAPMTYLRQVGDVWPYRGGISATQCQKGTRAVWLETLMDWAESPDAMAFMTMGSAGHATLEKAGDRATLEVEGRVELEGIRGKFDFVEVNDDGSLTLVDYKISGSYAVCKAFGIVTEKEPIMGPDGHPLITKTGPNRGKPRTRNVIAFRPDQADIRDYISQPNFYRVAYNRMLDAKEAGTPELGFPKPRITAMKIFFIVRDGGTQFAKARGVMRNTYLLDIPIVPDERVVERYVAKRDALAKSMAENPDVAPDRPWPVPCSPFEAWDGRKCIAGYCPVAARCAAHGDNPWIRPDQVICPTTKGGDDDSAPVGPSVEGIPGGPAEGV